MDYLSLLKDESKIDFTNTCFVKWDAACYSSEFKLTPKEFIRFAKADFKENNTKGLVNSLTNSKRAIDCQIDTVLSILGIDFDNPSISCNQIIESCNFNVGDLSLKLRLFSSLDFAPSGLISNVRLLRHKLEHYYEDPSKTEVKAALELSELFILAVESKLNDFMEGFVLTDTKSVVEKVHEHVFSKGVFFRYNSKSKKIEFQITKGKDWHKSEKRYIDQSSSEYYFLIKILNNINDDMDALNSLSVFLKYLKHPIPEKNIRLTITD